MTAFHTRPSEKSTADPEDARAAGPGQGPVAAPQEAPAAAGNRPVRREADPDEELAGMGDVQCEALVANPASAGCATAERLHQRRGVPHLVDAPVGGAPAEREIGRLANDQPSLPRRGVVEPDVGKRHVADRVVVQPGAVGATRQRCVVGVEEVVSSRVQLSQPAPRKLEARRHVSGLPVVSGGRHLDPHPAPTVQAKQ